MSKKSDELESAITEAASSDISLPTNLPEWMKNLEIKPGAKIISIRGIGSEDKENKTDVLIELENSTPLKISAKLSNADYFGNWYGHKRFLKEFGEQAFYRQTKDAAEWANYWTNHTKKPYVGVSICYGRRSGKTARRFLDIYTADDIMSVCRGFGNGYQVANCLYSSSDHPRNLAEILNNLVPITSETIMDLVGEFMVAYRPIDPMTEGTNRGKNVYARFQPYKPLPVKTTITSAKQLFQLGKFIEVEPNSLNHNHILNELESLYNIYIPRK
ncbi:hypothetical protein [Alkaliphilus oremlandii]|uniref:Uncharacterized protein n=1 Tax=Alkaliphilus oremlandii (strain OhILAs) TaxID=350688 RepID=A8MHW2_ALKOO|nr:hypothetical protein [Alkaliphilus oremlandii]ABW19394.1 hypothetical protein Clos_1854 [Alkaliphilus oremlandii OhILAs]